MCSSTSTTKFGVEHRLAELGIPPSLRDFVERQLDEVVAEDRLLLEVGATSGVEFTSATALAGARHDDPELTAVDVDQRCSRLARRHGPAHRG